MEIWKDIKGYEGKYQISNLGNVKSLNYKRSGKEKVLKAGKDVSGYLYVNLCKNGIYKPFGIHRLVAQAFIYNSDNKAEIDHINTIKDDNRVENLRWVTHKENMNNELTLINRSESRKGRFTGENNTFYGNHHSEETKLKISEANSKTVYCIELDRIFDCAMNAKRELGIANSNISKCCRGKLKSIGGYHWKYIELLPNYGI